MTDSILQNAFAQQPEPTTPIETPFRRIATPLPVPESLAQLETARQLFPRVNCYQPPILWDRAEGFQVYDAYGNCWIDLSSTAVVTNTGHGHPAIREALARHVEDGLLAQFSFASQIRIDLAQRLIGLAPQGMDKVYFWTTGSETIECALRLVREWGMRKRPGKVHVFSFTGDYHGCTLGAHQLSGDSAGKPWLPHPDADIHRLPFPLVNGEVTEPDWEAYIEQAVTDSSVAPDQIAAVFIETMQGWGAVPLPVEFAQALRRWADAHEVLLVFDEIQTGFGRTGKWFAHEHYGIRADLLCIGKGVTSSLPLAALLGPAEVLDVLPPGEVTTTHAAHPLSCVAALANIDVLEQENLLEAATMNGQLARDALNELQRRWPDRISRISGLGLLNAIHLRDPQTGGPDHVLARDLTWEAVRQGVMLFQTNRATLKVCPPLVIPPHALIEGVEAIGQALENLLGEG